MNIQQLSSTQKNRLIIIILIVAIITPGNSPFYLIEYLEIRQLFIAYRNNMLKLKRINSIGTPDPYQNTITIKTINSDKSISK